MNYLDDRDYEDVSFIKAPLLQMGGNHSLIYYV